MDTEDMQEKAAEEYTKYAKKLAEDAKYANNLAAEYAKYAKQFESPKQDFPPKGEGVWVDEKRNGIPNPSEYEKNRAAYVEYLLMCVRLGDWHGVSDAANDLRVLEAKQ
jgi:hypothetical protein